MDRREWLKITAATSAAMAISPPTFAKEVGKYQERFPFSAAEFGKDFKWGAACAAYQVEGAWNQDGKGPSIWDTFTHKKGNVHNFENADKTVDFYHNYREDIALAADLNLKVFRFSISWSRIFPEGVGEPNELGIEFYHSVIQACHDNNLEPWVTVYHWDLPQALEDKGGWLNRDIVSWFTDYAGFCAQTFPSVKNWMVMNEPAAFIGLGYMLGYHAPGKKGAMKFLKATHHCCLAMAESARAIRKELPEAQIGCTFSCSSVEPLREKAKDERACKRIDALVNRLYIEPSMGMGYPYDGFPALKKIEKFFEEGDEERLVFDFDFIGLQNYFRVVGKHSLFPPVVWAKQVEAKDRDVPMNEMGFEVYPEGMYTILKQFGEYDKIKKIIVTENGVCYKDTLEVTRVRDTERIKFFQDYLSSVLRAKNEGVPIEGYFIWSLTDNFEWSEGYGPRFGVIYVDYETQERYIKDSGFWFKELLKP